MCHSTKINGKSEHVPLGQLGQSTPSTLASPITPKQPTPLQGDDGEEWHRDCKYQAFKYKTSFKIWPIQDQAFKDVDQLLSLKTTEATSPTAALNHLNILWSKEPRLFALEYNNEGKRKYISAHFGRFINFYWRECNAKDRHYYELIREKTPCRLYFDIEYNKMANPGIEDDTNEILMKEFIEELEIEVKDRFNLLIGRSNIVDLDSSTEKKFSRHLIVHMPNGELFEDAVHCGKFVKALIGRLAEEVATKILEEKGRSTLSNYLFIFAKESVSHERDDQRSKTCFVDTGVYTRNRIFRILGSMKFGKQTSASLRIARQNEFPFPENFTNECFYKKEEVQNEENDDEDASHDGHQETIDWHVYAKALADTLIIPCDEERTAVILNVNDPNQKTLESCASDPSTCTIMRNPKSESNVKIRSYANSTGSSPFLVLDKYADNKLANWKGINGSVRSWSINDQTHLSSATITYQIKDNRWCENAQRCHKSNNVMWHVSISEYQYWQSCFDPDCRMSSFGGKRRDLPTDVKTAISEDLIAQEVQVSESFEKALLDLSVDDGLGSKNKDPYVDTECDDSFERALMNLNLSDTEVSADVIAANNEEGSDDVHSSFAVDADFERALMGINLDG